MKNKRSIIVAAVLSLVIYASYVNACWVPSSDTCGPGLYTEFGPNKAAPWNFGLRDYCLGSTNLYSGSTYDIGFKLGAASGQPAGYTATKHITSACYVPVILYDTNGFTIGNPPCYTYTQYLIMTTGCDVVDEDSGSCSE